MHTDFYAAYNYLPNIQRCLIHFLRDISDELEISPDDKSLYCLKDGIQSIIEKETQLKALGDARQLNPGRNSFNTHLKRWQN